MVGYVGWVVEEDKIRGYKSVKWVHYPCGAELQFVGKKEVVTEHGFLEVYNVFRCPKCGYTKEVLVEVKDLIMP